MKKLALSVLSGVLMSGAAQAGMAVNVLGGLNFQNDSITPANVGVTTSAKGALTYGATFEMPVNPVMDFEFGALSVGSKTKSSTALGDATVSTRSVMIPVMLRFTALPILDFGVGGYYAILPSKYTIEGSTIPGLIDGDYTTTTAAKNDYGLRAGVRAKLPLAPLLHVLVDLSYNFGLKDTDTTSTTEKTRAYSLLAGVAIGF